MREKWRKLNTVFLCLLMFSTPLTSTQLLVGFFQQPKVFIDSFSKQIEVEGKKFGAFYYSKITEYPNGTKNIHLSMTVENISRAIPKIRMNLTKTVSSSEFQSLKTNNYEKSSVSLDTLADHPDIPEELWDGVYAVIKGVWDGYWVKYNHDNNIWRGPHPWLYNISNLDVRYDVKGDEKIHTHIGRRLLQEWIAGNITDEEAMQRILGTKKLATSIIGETVISILSYHLGGLKGLIISIIASIIFELIQWFLSETGRPTVEWLINTVEAESNDGFCWSWGFHTTDFDVLVVEPFLGWLSMMSECCVREYSQILSQYHRMYVVLYTAREFQVTWGADRDGSPQTWTREIWYGTSLPAGIFADYFSLYK